jgi:hypothetical protein
LTGCAVSSSKTSRFGGFCCVRKLNPREGGRFIFDYAHRTCKKFVCCGAWSVEGRHISMLLVVDSHYDGIWRDSYKTGKI